MVDMSMYEFKYLNTGKITPEESSMNAYTEEVYESEQVHTSIKKLRVILYEKHEKSDLNKVVNF